MIANHNPAVSNLRAFNDDPSNSMESLTPLAHVGPDYGDEKKRD